MDGFSFNIDEKFLKQLESADKAMSDLISKNNQLSKSAVEAFTQITTHGVQPYLEKLKQQKSALEAIANIKFSEPITAEMEKVKNETKSTIDKINAIITSLKGISTPMEQKKVLADFTKYETSLLMDRIARNDSYNAKLVQQERSYHEQRKKMYSELFSFQAQAQREANALTERVYTKTGGATWNVSADEVIRQNQQDLEARRQYVEQRKAMYEKMFDEIAKREKQVQSDISRYERERLDDDLRKYKQRKKDQENVDKHYYNKRLKEYEELFKAIERTEARQRMLTNARGDSSKGAMNYFNRLYNTDSVKSIDKMNIALQKLRDAQNRLNLNTDEGVKKYYELGRAISRIEQDINKATNASGNLKKSHSKLLNTSDQLQRKFALLFSISAIQGYMGKLVEVRKEFELQQKTLSVLLQNKDEADKLWQQTIDLAVKSPFKVKELVSYTKQLAAYRIETDKLHDTTKRLADVSAGLGVDMQRLILAFGQVKAANYLRGTELRQFTEAGIPMLDELAKMFTELEGRMVSAGDVFERISKRMVTFSDVEQVFHRLTNAGGVFYNMQEEQSKTLHGMISNLHDSIDLMLNDIGKAHDGVLKDSVTIVRTFIENWREVGVQLKDAAIAFASIKSFAFLLNKGLKMTSLTFLGFETNLKRTKLELYKWTANLQIADWRAMGYSKTMSVLMRVFSNARVAALGLAQAFLSIAPVAIIAGLYELYRYLTKASREAKRLKEDLQAIYSEDTRNFDKQIEEFNSLALKLKIVNKGSKEHKDVISQLNSQYGEYLGFIVTEKTTYDELASSIESVNYALMQKAKANTYEKAFNRILEDSSKEIDNLREKVSKTFTDWGFYAEGEGETKILPSKSEINDIFRLIDEKLKETKKELTFDELNEIVNKYMGKNVFVSGALNFQLITDYSKEMIKLYKAEEELESKLDGLYEAGHYSTRQMREEMQKLNKERDDALAKETSRIGKEKIQYNYLVKRVELESKYQGIEDKSVIKKRIKDLTKVNETIADVNRRLIDSTAELGEDAVNRVYITAQDAAQGVSAVAESMAAGYKQAQEDIKMQNALKEAGTVHDQDALENAEKMSKAYYKMLEFMGRLDLLESKGNKKEQAVNILNKRINLVKEINKEYEKLTERFGSDKAKKQILEAYKDTFRQAFEGTGVKLSGLVIDTKKLKEEGEKSGQIFSEEMTKKMQEVISSGTYIRSASNAFKEKLKKDEGLGLELYDDSTKKIIKTTTDFQKAVGTVTIGYGHAITKLEEAQKYLGREITESEANDIFNQDVDKHVQALNNVLDKYQDLILTQEQYDALLNRTFQGGGGLISLALQYATNVDKGIAHFEKLDTKLQKVGKTFEEEFGADFIDKFKNAQTAVERLALVMETMGLTTVASGSNIDNRLFKGMKDRAQRMAAEFRGDLEIVKLLQKSAIDVSQIDFTNLQGVVETLKKLKPIADKEGKEAQLTLKQAISKVEAEIGIEAEITNEQKILDRVESLFGQYEVSVELEKMDIPPSLIKKLFKIDTLKLPELKEKIVKEFASGAGAGAEALTQELSKSLLSINWKVVESLVGEKEMQVIKSKLEQINDFQDKALKESMKKFVKFLTTKADEVAMIQNKGAKEIFNAQNWFLSGQINAEQYSEAIKNIVQEVNESISKINLEKFKDSSEYISAMGNMAGYSIDELNKLATSISKLIVENAATMGVEEIKAYNDALEKINAQIEKMKRPFAKTTIQEIREIKKLEKELTEEKEKQVELQKKLQKQQNTLSGLKSQLNLLQSMPQSEQRDSAITDVLNQINDVQNGIGNTNNQLNTTAGNISNIGAKLDSLLKGMGSSLAVVDAIVKGISQGIQATVQLFNDVKTMLDSFGEDTDTAFWQDMTIAMETLDTMNQKATQGWEDLKSGNIAGAVANTIGVVTTLLTGLNRIHDAKYERTIVKETEAIERMQKSYEKLGKAVEDAYSIKQLQVSGQNAKKNLEAQVAAYERMIQAEEDKKKTDKKRIEEWSDSIDDLKEQIEDLSEELVSTATAGIMDSVLSASQEFTDAWLEAFKETGNGLSGLEDNFKETMLEMVKQQASMLISQSYVERWKKQLEQYINPSDLELSTDEAKKWVDAVQTSLPQLNEALENYFNAMQQAGVDISGGELSGLQKGIQSASETTMQAVEAYLNSIRFFVSDSNSKLTQIADFVIGNNEGANPILSELKTQTELVRGISTLLNSLTSPHPTLSGRGLKVII